MVLQAHLKKHIIALGGWLLMYTSGPPPGLANDHTFSGFFLLPSLSTSAKNTSASWLHQCFYHCCFYVGCPKINTSQEKIALTGWHGTSFQL